jgi:hypothetical protein
VVISRLIRSDIYSLDRCKPNRAPYWPISVRPLSQRLPCSVVHASQIIHYPTLILGRYRSAATSISTFSMLDNSASPFDCGLGLGRLSYVSPAHRGQIR